MTIRVACGLLCGVLLGGPLASVASAQAAPPSVLFSDRAFADGLAVALRSGDYGRALALIDSRPDVAITPEGIRLRAELMARLGRPDDALLLLEGHLASNGSDAIARYQVGEIHFEAGRDSSATLAYRLALSGQLDATRRDLIQRRLETMQARRGLRLSLTAALVPDSNINNATSAGTIDLYGLQFVLSDDARQRSGVSASISANAERRWIVTDKLSVSAGGGASLLDASGRTFDLVQFSGFAGPEWRLSPDARLSVVATYRDVRFGGEPLEVSTGLRMAGDAQTDRFTQWNASGHVDRIDSQRAREWDGWTYGVQASRTRYLGPSAFWRATVAHDVYDLVGAEADFQISHVAAGRLISVPFSAFAYIEPYARVRDFQQRSTAFGVRRQDFELGVSARVSKRDWSFRNAFPFIQVTASRSWSNVVFGEYSRSRVEFGLTRDF